MTARRAVLVLLIAAAAAAAVALNLLLLGQAGSSPAPVGKLMPAGSSPAAPGWTIRPTTGSKQLERERERSDD